MLRRGSLISGSAGHGEGAYLAIIGQKYGFNLRFSRTPFIVDVASMRLHGQVQRRVMTHQLDTLTVIDFFGRRFQFFGPTGGTISTPRLTLKEPYFRKNLLKDKNLTSPVNDSGSFTVSDSGGREMNRVTENRLAGAFRDRLGGFIREALDDPDVIEVMVNACRRVWLDNL